MKKATQEQEFHIIVNMQVSFKLDDDEQRLRIFKYQSWVELRDSLLGCEREKRRSERVRSRASRKRGSDPVLGVWIFI